MNAERNWLLLLVVLGVGVPVGTWMAVPDARKHAPAADEKPAAARGKGARAESGAAKDKKKDKKKDSGDGDAEEAGAELKALFARGEKEASFLFAALPDPRESVSPRGFDEQLAALRRALEMAGYSKFDSWDPWFGADADDLPAKPWRTLPGLMFFRRENDRPLGIFIIGETPTRGIHEQALLAALDLWGRPPDNGTTRPRANEPLRVLGPSSSGATRSLADTLAAWKKANDWFKGKIRAVSGSATSRSNAALLSQAGIEFDATIHDDDTLKAFVSDYLKGQLGIRSEEVAILTESSSAYGQHLARASKTDTSESAESTRSLVLRYPPYLRSLRQTYARTRGSKPPVAGTQSVLDIETEDDLAAALFDPHAAPSRAMAELSLNRVIEAIAAERIRAVEIAALDPQDAAFLASRVRESFPTVTVVILSSDVLYLHRDYEVIDGLLIASTYPLSNRTQRITYPFNGVYARHSFPSEHAEGTFNATLLLAGFPHMLADYGPPLRLQKNGQSPALWMSVVSNGDIWPVHTRTRDDMVAHGPLESERGTDAYVHVEKTATVGGVPADAWRATRGVGFYSFVALFSILSLASIACYAWAQKLGDRARDAAAPLLVRVLGDLPNHPNEWYRRSFMSVLLLVLVVLWSFVAVVQRGAVARPTESFLTAPVIRMAGHLAIATQALVSMTLVYSALRIPEWATFVNWLREKLPKDGFYQRRALWKKLPTIGLALQVLVSVLAGAAIVVITERSLDRWLAHCGFPTSLVGADVDARCQRFVLFLDRARALNGGVSLITTLFVLAVGYFVWYGAHLYKAWHTDGFRELRTQHLFDPEGSAHLAAIDRAGEAACACFEKMKPENWLWVPMIGCATMAYLRAARLPFFENTFYLNGIALVYALYLMLLVYGCGRALELWWRFRALLQRIATVPGMQPAGEGATALLTYLGGPWSPKVAQAWRNTAAGLSPDIRQAVEAAVNEDGTIDQSKWLVLLRAEQAGIADQSQKEEAIAWGKMRTLRVWALVNYMRQHLLNVLRATSVGLILLLVVVSMYPFKGERLLLGMVLALGVLTTTTVFLIFLNLDRDYVMGRLTGKDKAERSWSPTFVRGLVLHAGLPLLGILSLRFPEVGGVVASLTGPLGALLGK